CLSCAAAVTTPFSPLSLHDALPISRGRGRRVETSRHPRWAAAPSTAGRPRRFREDDLDVEDEGSASPGRCASDGLDRASALPCQDRKSTRLNSSHQIISYAVFCLKK